MPEEKMKAPSERQKSDSIGLSSQDADQEEQTPTELAAGQPDDDDDTVYPSGISVAAILTAIFLAMFLVALVGLYICLSKHKLI
jgi:hypothetical protein